MGSNGQLLIGVTIVFLTCLAVFPVYRWWQQKRVRRVELWVKNFLLARFGAIPNYLNINCSQDPLWPVLVYFETPSTERQHRMQFDCRRSQHTWLLVSEREEPC